MDDQTFEMKLSEAEKAEGRKQSRPRPVKPPTAAELAGEPEVQAFLTQAAAAVEAAANEPPAIEERPDLPELEEQVYDLSPLPSVADDPMDDRPMIARQMARDMPGNSGRFTSMDTPNLSPFQSTEEKRLILITREAFEELAAYGPDGFRRQVTWNQPQMQENRTLVYTPSVTIDKSDQAFDPVERQARIDAALAARRQQQIEDAAERARRGM